LRTVFAPILKISFDPGQISLEKHNSLYYQSLTQVKVKRIQIYAQGVFILSYLTNNNRSGSARVILAATSSQYSNTIPGLKIPCLKKMVA
jgi:hypothetical protein